MKFGFNNFIEFYDNFYIEKIKEEFSFFSETNVINKLSNFLISFDGNNNY